MTKNGGIPRTIAYSASTSPSFSRSAMALKVCSIWCCSSWVKRAESLWLSKAFVGYILPKLPLTPLTSITSELAKVDFIYSTSSPLHSHHNDGWGW